MPSVVTITFNEFAKDGAEEGLKAAIVATAVRGHEIAVENSAVDLGEQKNGYMWIKGWNQDVFSFPKAGGFNSQGGKQAKAKDKISTDPGIVATLGNGVAHTIYTEFGTKFMPAQPALRLVYDTLNGANAQQIAKKWGGDAMQKEFEKRQKKVVKK